MTRRYLTPLFAGLVALLLFPDWAQAQVRPEGTLFIKPRIGVASHFGDTEKSPFNFNFDNWKVDGKIPFSLAGELGYQFTPGVSLALGYQYADYPLIWRYGPEVPPNAEDDDSKRMTAQLLLRLKAGGATARVAPFLTLGGNVSFGGNDGPAAPAPPGILESETAFGPVVGAGLDIVLNDRTSFVFEWISNFTFPDKAIDGREESIIGDEDSSFAPFDMLNSLSLGLQFNFKSAFTPVDVLAIDCPTTLTTEQTGNFSATVNEKATQPVEYTWNFGDGQTGAGMMGSHRFTQPGTYTVTFTASNARSTDSESCTVTVTPPPVPAEAVSITSSPTAPCVPDRAVVNFSANVRGTQPVSYSWDFGDGTTGTGATPSHTYREAGTYTVTLTVRNEFGENTRTMQLNVSTCEPEYCRTVTEMNAAYFDRNSSTLTDAARASLEENLQILRDCPNLCVRIEGFAGPGERNADQLSEDRANAVRQFYIDNGIDASRINAMGMGMVGGQTSKKDGAGQFRRADSIPMPCSQMR